MSIVSLAQAMQAQAKLWPCLTMSCCGIGAGKSWTQCHGATGGLSLGCCRGGRPSTGDGRPSLDRGAITPFRPNKTPHRRKKKGWWVHPCVVPCLTSRRLQTYTQFSCSNNISIHQYLQDSKSLLWKSCEFASAVGNLLQPPF